VLDLGAGGGGSSFRQAHEVAVESGDGLQASGGGGGGGSGVESRTHGEGEAVKGRRAWGCGSRSGDCLRGSLGGCSCGGLGPCSLPLSTQNISSSIHHIKSF
jgi:hypothetical protein